MEGTIGKALREARLKKEITLEEAARATKIRAERLADLERDEYGRFPNLAYARGFLVLYSKYLGVDMKHYAAPEVASPVVLGDYAYLQSEKGVDSLRFKEGTRTAPPRRSRWMVGLLVFIGAALLGILFSLLVLKILRLPIDELVKRQEAGIEEAEPAPPEPTPTASPAATPPPPKAEPIATPAVEPLPETPVFPASLTPAPEGGLMPVPGIPRALPAGSAPPPVEESFVTPFPAEEPMIPRALPVTPTPAASP